MKAAEPWQAEYLGFFYFSSQNEENILMNNLFFACIVTHKDR